MRPDDRPVSLARQLAADLLTIGAVSLRPDDPFTWASGRRAPIYCDNRLTLAYPEVRRRIATGFVQRLAGAAMPHVVVGTATAGIPHAAWVADRLDLPMAYVRSAPKQHGKGNQIEGRVASGQRVVVIEDLVSTGGSSVAVVDALRAAGAEVDAVLAIFSYGLPAAAEAFADADVPLHTLTTFETLQQVAVASKRLPDDALDTLRAWQRDPAAWSATHG